MRNPRHSTKLILLSRELAGYIPLLIEKLQLRFAILLHRKQNPHFAVAIPQIQSYRPVRIAATSKLTTARFDFQGAAVFVFQKAAGLDETPPKSRVRPCGSRLLGFALRRRPVQNRRIFSNKRRPALSAFNVPPASCRLFDASAPLLYAVIPTEAIFADEGPAFDVLLMAGANQRAHNRTTRSCPVGWGSIFGKKWLRRLPSYKPDSIQHFLKPAP
jgi:hypothetical protein